jgi:hypothetical protein
VIGSATAERTLPDHARCDRHRYYKLSCDQYESLLARSGQLCEICQRPPAKQAKLLIDHGGSLWAVRGLLCNPCNTRLQHDNAWCPAAKKYLANAWWVQECVKLGYAGDWRPPTEPPVGSAIRNQWGIIWVHCEPERWHAPNQDGHGWPQHCWKQIHSSYGPHNLVPYDLHRAIDDQSIPGNVKWTLCNAPGWAELRSVLGLPEPQPKPRVREWSARDGLPWLRDSESTVRALRSFLTRDECLRVAELLSEDA